MSFSCLNSSFSSPFSDSKEEHFSGWLKRTIAIWLFHKALRYLLCLSIAASSAQHPACCSSPGRLAPPHPSPLWGSPDSPSEGCLVGSWCSHIFVFHDSRRMTWLTFHPQTCCWISSTAPKALQIVEGPVPCCHLPRAAPPCLSLPPELCLLLYSWTFFWSPSTFPRVLLSKFHPCYVRCDALAAFLFHLWNYDSPRKGTGAHILHLKSPSKEVSWVQSYLLRDSFSHSHSKGRHTNKKKGSQVCGFTSQLFLPLTDVLECKQKQVTFMKPRHFAMSNSQQAL